MKKQITIAGGGLSGLSLAVALRRRDIDVELIEAGQYPRHRVCGEFICGVSRGVLENLGIAEMFVGASQYRESVWFSGDSEILREELPQSAWGLSRYYMDQWLAREFVSLGGVLRTGVRGEMQGKEGFVWAAGRKPKNSGWIGLKAHIRGYPSSSELEMHLGKAGYVGIVLVEEGWYNVCGLFRKRVGVKGKKQHILERYLEACGLTTLAERVASSEIREGSHCAVAGFELGTQPMPLDVFALGDAQSMIAPYTGNGMSMAFEAAELAIEPLVDYTRGAYSWRDSCVDFSSALKQQFQRRLVIANTAHPCILSEKAHGVLANLTKHRLLPFQTLFSLTRS